MNDLGVLCAFHLALGVLHTIEKLFSFLSFFLSFFACRDGLLSLEYGSFLAISGYRWRGRSVPETVMVS